MVVIRLIGGIGNQLFVYAYARSIEIKYNTSVYADIISGYKNDPFGRKYELDKFNIKIKTASLYKSFFFPIKKRFPLLAKFAYPNSLYINENDILKINPEIFSNANFKKIYMEGYWQQPSYFKEYFNTIREELKVVSVHTEQNNKLAQLIKSCKSVGIHIRRLNIEPLVPLEFYIDSIDNISKRISNPEFFCFSDDINWCKRNLKTGRAIYFVDNNADKQVEDFWLLSSCKHFIISNSTFAWWATQLSESNYKNILSPDEYYWTSKNLAYNTID